jgi:hypothetical protein
LHWQPTRSPLTGASLLQNRFALLILDGVDRADCHALPAVDALIIVDSGKIVFYCDGIYWAFLFTATASNAAYRAYAPYVFAQG